MRFNKESLMFKIFNMDRTHATYSRSDQAYRQARMGWRRHVWENATSRICTQVIHEGLVRALQMGGKVKIEHR